MKAVIDTLLDAFIAAEKLPASYKQAAHDYFLPLSDELAERSRTQGETLVLGIHGGQGSGKSTLSALLARVLTEVHGLKTAVLSIDDFYLGRAERQRLAANVHPLLATRGVPGTHEVALAIATLEQLKTLKPGERLDIVRFDKSQDDRAPQAHWDAVIGPVDVVIVEGWCVGLEAQAPEALVEPVNALEAEDDQDGHWRRWVNEQLAGDYQRWFALLDFLLMLKVPSFEQVYEWRTLQEQKLAEKTKGQGIMRFSEIQRFVQHYERLTRHALNTLPAKADRVLLLDKSHQVYGVEAKL